MKHRELFLEEDLDEAQTEHAFLLNSLSNASEFLSRGDYQAAEFHFDNGGRSLDALIQLRDKKDRHYRELQHLNKLMSSAIDSRH